MTVHDQEKNEAFRQLVHEARRSSERLAKVSARAERPQVGDLYVVPTLEHDVEWLALDCDPRDDSRWRLVLVDLDPVAGCRDLAIQDEACGALTIRAAHEVLVPMALLEVSPRTGRVPEKYLPQVRALVHEPSTDWAAEEAEGTARYEDRRRACARAAASLEALAGTFERMGEAQGGGDVPLRRMLQWAAVLVVAVGSITLLARHGGFRELLPGNASNEPVAASAISLNQVERTRRLDERPKVVRVGKRRSLPLTLLLLEARPEASYRVRVFSADSRSPLFTVLAEGREGSHEVSIWLPEARLPTGLIRLELEEDMPGGTVRTYRFVAEEDE